jgi:hypothetical protein
MKKTALTIAFRTIPVRVVRLRSKRDAADAGHIQSGSNEPKGVHKFEQQNDQTHRYHAQSEFPFTERSHSHDATAVGPAQDRCCAGAM